MSCAQGNPKSGGCDCGAGLYNIQKRQCDCFDKGKYNTTTKECECPPDYPLDDLDTKRCRSKDEAAATFGGALTGPYAGLIIAAIVVLGLAGIGLVAGGILYSERGIADNRARRASLTATWDRIRNPVRISPEELAARGMNDNGAVGGAGGAAAGTGLGEGAWTRIAPPLTTRLTISGMTSENGGIDNGQGDMPLTSRLSIPTFTGSS